MTFGKVLSELVLVGKFAAVGVVATTVHVCVVALIISKTTLFPILANAIAFIVAFGFSFFGNFYWTFSRPNDAVVSMARFFLVSFGAFITNSVLLSVLLQLGFISVVNSAVLAATVVPFLTYVGGRLWGFRNKDLY